MVVCGIGAAQTEAYVLNERKMYMHKEFGYFRHKLLQVPSIEN